MAKQALDTGKVIAYPTEAVWGLGCDPFNEDAVMQLLALKTRSVNKGLILITGNIDHFSSILEDLDDRCRQKLNTTWPGPYTWLVPHRNRYPPWICGQFDTVALRVSDHPDVRAITQAFGGAIVSTSANPQGLDPARDRNQVEEYFTKDPVPFITHGELGQTQQPSEVRDLLTNKLIRAGG